MYQPSQNFINELNKTSRLFRARITCGTDTLTEEIKKMIFTLGSCGADTFTIGSVFASYVDITLSSTETSLAGKEMFVEIGLLLPDDTVEYIPMGYFTASPADISKSRDQTILKATDRISSKCGGLYIPSITFPATIQAVMNDVSTQAGVRIKTSLPTTGVIQKEMKNITYREILGYLSGLLGGFCYADREGNICIAAYPSTSSLNIENERSWTMEMGEEYSVDSLKVIVSEGGEDADGNEVAGVSYSAGSGNGITVSNQYMTESLFNDMKSRVLNYSFCSGTARVLGDPRLDPADAITAINFAGKEFFVPCMSITHEYDGGLATTITTPSQAASDEEVRGPLTQQVEQLAADMVLTKEVVAKKITADEADLKFATIERANIIEAEIDKVSGEFADYKVIVTEDFTAVNAEINTVKGDLADYKTVIADDFTAVNAEITTVKGDLADYKTVVAGDIDALSGRITLVSGELADYKTVVSNELITAKGWMAEGSIGNAQISSVDAAKIKSGILDTALVTVKGTNGNLQIIDNTISISDSARVRVQVGKDGTGDYTLAVWDAAGNLIWDALGATENTIQRPIIRDEVVADDAAIKGTKLDIESVVAAVNGATTKISGTVVQVGNQTLNVALSEQETTITEQGQQISDHETRITANEESIQLKVSSKDFETYKSTVNGEITTVKSRLSTAETSITAMEGQIALKVEQTDIDTAISNVEIGGRNLWINSSRYRESTPCALTGSTTDIYTTSFDGKVIYSKEPFNPGDTITIQGKSNLPWASSHGGGFDNHDTVGYWIYLGTLSKVLSGSYNKAIFLAGDGSSTTFKKTYTIPNIDGVDPVYIAFRFNVYSYNNVTITGKFWDLKLEKGNKATDWTPAPEDTEESITTISNKQSEIITNLDSITTRVSSVESAQTTQAGEVASMESRLTVAEQLVTKDGIISTVGSYYTTLDDVNGAVNEIEVGGRNLLVSTYPLFLGNTKSGYTFAGWANDFIGHDNLIKMMEPSTTYTLSYKFRLDSLAKNSTSYNQSAHGSLFLYSGVSGYNPVVIGSMYGKSEADTWEVGTIVESTCTFTTPSTLHDSDSNYRIIAYTRRSMTEDGSTWIRNETGTFYDIKLEKGNKATDWTPAPEDMVDKANIVSCINQTAEEIKIQASKISLEGLITANENFKILTDGSMETISGKIGGWSIGNNKIYSDNPYNTDVIYGDSDYSYHEYTEGTKSVSLVSDNSNNGEVISVLYEYLTWTSDDTENKTPGTQYVKIFDDGRLKIGTEGIWTDDIPAIDTTEIAGSYITLTESNQEEYTCLITPQDIQFVSSTASSYSVVSNLYGLESFFNPVQLLDTGYLPYTTGTNYNCNWSPYAYILINFGNYGNVYNSMLIPYSDFSVSSSGRRPILHVPNSDYAVQVWKNGTNQVTIWCNISDSNWVIRIYGIGYRI